VKYKTLTAAKAAVLILEQATAAELTEPFQVRVDEYGHVEAQFHNPQHVVDWARWIQADSPAPAVSTTTDHNGAEWVHYDWDGTLFEQPIRLVCANKLPSVDEVSA